MPPTTLEALEAAALQLSVAERSQLAERLLVSLEEDDEIMLAWYAEAAQRGEAFARGEETASPASEVIERLQAMFQSQPVICPICKCGHTRPGFASVTLERDAMTLFFKSVPAQVCDNCGEEFIDEVASANLLETAPGRRQAAVKHGL